jgi:hypothetical protein
MDDGPAVADAPERDAARRQRRRVLRRAGASALLVTLAWLALSG